MPRLLYVALIAAVTVVACSGDDDAEPSEPWMAATSYNYTVNSSCGEQWFIGTYEIVVDNRTVANAIPLDSSAESLLEHSGLAHVPTLEQLVDEYRTAIAEDAHKAEIEQAPVDGHPTMIAIDWGLGIDTQSCYLITDYSATN